MHKALKNENFYTNFKTANRSFNEEPIKFALDTTN